MAGSNPICLECGLCCNGVIFANGQLQPGDDAERLALLGLKLLPIRSAAAVAPKFGQPCAALEGCRCAIYAERPEYCRSFECALLKRVLAQELEADAARRIIRLARRRSQTVGRLLRDLGDMNEHQPLAARFRRMQRRMEQQPLGETDADRFGELTLAVLDLQALLSREFYPGA